MMKNNVKQEKSKTILRPTQVNLKKMNGLMENQRKGTRQRGVRLYTLNTGLSLTLGGSIRSDACSVLVGMMSIKE
jgi:hypothetical protein